jgi:SnoaL-like domain
MPRSWMATLVVIATSLISQILGPSVVSAQDATPAGTAECPTTTPEENKELVGRFYDAVASGDDATLASLMAEDHVFHGPAGEPSDEPGSEDTVGWASEHRQTAQQLTVIADPIVAEDDLVMAYLTWSGINEATQEPVEWSAVGLFRIECGAIAENWAVADELGQMMALGVITEEELQSVTAEATPAP